MKEGVLRPTVKEIRLFECYYPNEKIKGINFLKDSEKDILVVFDDEILGLKLGDTKIKKFVKIELTSSFCLDQSVFQGFNQGFYVFCKPYQKYQDRLRLVDVEYLEQSVVCQTIQKEMQNSEKLEISKQFDTENGEIEVEYQRFSSDEDELTD